ncbi:MAG: YtxH domain-containing protein [Cyanobacteria bacterium J06581_3]
MSDSKSSGLLGGMIIGGALGAIAGILVAPRTGKETRRILKKSADALPELAEDLATSIQFQADRLSEGSLSNWDQTLMRLREAVVAGRAASRQEWVRSADGFTADGFTTVTDDTSPEMRAQSATSQDAASDIIDD